MTEDTYEPHPDQNVVKRYREAEISLENDDRDVLRGENVQLLSNGWVRFTTYGGHDVEILPPRKVGGIYTHE